MNDGAPRGFIYVVSDEQLARFALAPIAQRFEIRAAWAERRRG